MRLAWGEFLNWLEKSERQCPAATVKQLREQINGKAGDLKQEVFDGLVESPHLMEVMVIWREFVEKLHCSNGELSAYLMSYVDMVEGVVLGLLHASQERN